MDMPLKENKKVSVIIAAGGRGKRLGKGAPKAFVQLGGKQLISYSLEVFNAVGDTLAVVTLRESEIEALANDAVLHVRRLEEASV